MSEIKYVAVLDDKGVYVGCDEVAPEHWKDGPNRIALQAKPDVALGRYRLERSTNKFGYRFVPVANVSAIENAASSEILPVIVRAILDMSGRGAPMPKDLSALREFMTTLDAAQSVDAALEG